MVPYITTPDNYSTPMAATINPTNIKSIQTAGCVTTMDDYTTPMAASTGPTAIATVPMTAKIQ